jgi:hypothetical protein
MSRFRSNVDHQYNTRLDFITRCLSSVATKHLSTTEVATVLLLGVLTEYEHFVTYFFCSYLKLRKRHEVRQKSFKLRK